MIGDTARAWIVALFVATPTTVAVGAAGAQTRFEPEFDVLSPVEGAQNEGQLAGVMAYELAHLALRHGITQASKAYVAQTAPCSFSIS